MSRITTELTGPIGRVAADSAVEDGVVAPLFFSISAAASRFSKSLS